MQSLKKLYLSVKRSKSEQISDTINEDLEIKDLKIGSKNIVAEIKIFSQIQKKCQRILICQSFSEKTPLTPEN